ncbi:hypothetical protein L3Q82_011596, partial [Scortum barcoo]
VTKWWIFAHHLKLSVDKTEMIFIPGKEYPVCDLYINIKNSLEPSWQLEHHKVLIIPHLDYNLKLVGGISCTIRSLLLIPKGTAKPILYSEPGQTVQSNPSTTFCYLPGGLLVPHCVGAQLSLIKITSVCCPGSTM